MKHVSIFNEVIGPVMRGPSSSHTAASYHLGRLIRDLLDGDPKKIIISFVKNGSYAEVYHQQGSDLGFAAGIIGAEITSDDFIKALEIAKDVGIEIKFKVKEFAETVHPNTIEIIGFSNKGSQIHAIAVSIGGGAVQINELNSWPVYIKGDSYDLIIDSVSAVHFPQRWLASLISTSSSLIQRYTGLSDTPSTIRASYPDLFKLSAK